VRTLYKKEIKGQVIRQSCFSGFSPNQVAFLPNKGYNWEKKEVLGRKEI